MIRLGVGRRVIVVQFPPEAKSFSLFHTSYRVWGPRTVLCNDYWEHFPEGRAVPSPLRLRNMVLN
jgi:hypothetical protein